MGRKSCDFSLLFNFSCFYGLQAFLYKLPKRTRSYKFSKSVQQRGCLHICYIFFLVLEIETRMILKFCFSSSQFLVVSDIFSSEIGTKILIYFSAPVCVCEINWYKQILWSKRYWTFHRNSKQFRINRRRRSFQEYIYWFVCVYICDFSMRSM